MLECFEVCGGGWWMAMRRGCRKKLPNSSHQPHHFLSAKIKTQAHFTVSLSRDHYREDAKEEKIKSLKSTNLDFSTAN